MIYINNYRTISDSKRAWMAAFPLSLYKVRWVFPRLLVSVIMEPHQPNPPFPQLQFHPTNMVFLPVWPANLQLAMERIHMILPDLLIEMEFRLFMASVIEIDPRYRRLEVLVSIEKIEEPEIVAVRTKLAHHWTDWESPRGALPSAEVLRELLGLSPPRINFRPPIKIIS